MNMEVKLEVAAVATLISSVLRCITHVLEAHVAVSWTLLVT